MYHLITHDKFEVKLTMSFRGQHKLSVGDLFIYLFILRAALQKSPFHSERLEWLIMGHCRNRQHSHLSVAKPVFLLLITTPRLSSLLL